MKEPTKKSLKKKAWKLFSLYIRRKYSKDGYVICVTCGKKAHYKELQAGHFIAGRNNSVLFEEDGVHPQCVGCNMFKGGNPIEYFLFMEKKYGRGRVDELITQSKKAKKYSIGDYMELIDKYTDALAGLDIRGEHE